MMKRSAKISQNLRNLWRIPSKYSWKLSSPGRSILNPFIRLLNLVTNRRPNVERDQWNPHPSSVLETGHRDSGFAICFLEQSSGSAGEAHAEADAEDCSVGLLRREG